MDKPESKLWKAAFGMSKQEVVEHASEDFRKYMTMGHFNMGNVKFALLENQSTDLVDPSKPRSYVQKVKDEYKFVKDYTMNSVYNFYSEGVLRRFVLRLAPMEGAGTTAEQMRIRFYVAMVVSAAVAYAMWERRNPAEPET